MAKKEKRISLYKKIWCKIRYWQSLYDVSDTELVLKESTARRRCIEYHEPTMSFIEKSAAFPEIMTLSPAHSQYRIPVRLEAWNAVILGLFRRLHQ